jgi:predicted nuclease with TOPRIM domain
MSGNGTTPRRAGGAEMSFETVGERMDGRVIQQEEEDVADNFEAGREVLVLQRVDEEQLEELRKEKESLSRELEELKKAKEDGEQRVKREMEERHRLEMEENRRNWESERGEFEQTVKVLEATKGTQLDLSLLKATTAYKASQTGYEYVVTAAAREREELFGALEGLKMIAKGLDAWEALA